MRAFCCCNFFICDPTVGFRSNTPVVIAALSLLQKFAGPDFVKGSHSMVDVSIHLGLSFCFCDLVLQPPVFVLP